ncbi:hypothetical protein MCP1_70053 [Candidatus Terasakiella magnetica]|nr:hypothetical protein MCP1_70053 [Candidatus Terasakiella magnetica]
MDVTTVILADQSGPSLSPLSDGIGVAMLPLLGKPLLVHTIEDLAQAGLREVLVVAGSFTRAISRCLGDGRRWGMNIKVVEGRGDESWSDHPLLVVRADIVRQPLVGAFLELASQAVEGRMRALANGQECGIDLWRPGVAGVAEIHLDEACRVVDGFPAFHLANMEALDGRFSGLLIDGRAIVDEDGDELIAGRGSRVDAKSLTRGRAYVGAFTRIASTSRLLGHVVIGQGVVIEPGTRIENSIILPGTYVGADLDVRGAIVAPGRLIAADTGIITEIADPFLLGRVASSKEDEPLRKLFGKISDWTARAVS